jgi:malonyl CoA-acyl carrier protein transacylase/acyl carrier protein
VLAHVARESQQRFLSSAKARLAVIAADADELKSRLEQAVKSLETNKAPAFTVPGAIFFSEQATDGGVAFVFSGQGSQYVTMGADLAAVFDAARGVWDDEARAKVGEVALHEKVFPRPVFTDADREAAERALRATEWAQPAIGAMTASQLALLDAIGLRPDCVAGHSFGEVSALFAAGALDRESFLRVARQRGEQMARAAGAGGEGGGMTAVAASIEQVESVLEASLVGDAAASPAVVIANHNDPRQVVISGATPALEEAERRFVAAGLKVQRLPVAAAFHSPIVAGSVAPFAKALEGVAFQAPSVPVFGNATAEPYPVEPEGIRDLLASSIAKRVRFVEVIEAMYGRGVRTFVEVGPGSVLSGMIGRICGDRPHRAIPLDRPGRHGVTSLWQSLAQLAVAGHAIDFTALWREFDLGPDPRAQPKPKMTVRISGTNYGKKYPPEGGAAGLPRPNPPRAQAAKRPNGEVMETKEQKSSAAPETPDGRSKPPAAAMPRAPVPPRANGGTPHGDGGNGIATNGSTKAPAHTEPAPNGATLVTRGHQTAWRQGDTAAWLSAYEAIQCRTAEAHAIYQRTMAQCHLAFLHAAEQSAMALASMAVGAPNLAVSAPRGMALPSPPAEDHEAFGTALPPIQWSPPAHSPAPAMVRSPVPRAPAPVAVSDAGLAVIPSSPSAVPFPSYAPVLRAPTPAPVPMPAAALEAPKASVPAAPSALVIPADGDVKTFLFNVISEKTGYPVEILNLDQQLEADLGIDSIKRVEILSAFEGQIPDIKDVNLEEVASLSTLRDVVGFMEKFSDKLGLAKKKE